jgi:hypothetical protein
LHFLLSTEALWGLKNKKLIFGTVSKGFLKWGYFEKNKRFLSWILVFTGMTAAH